MRPSADRATASSTQGRISELLLESRTIAVLGASNRTGRPAYYVPKYLARSGYDVFPVNPRHLGETLWGHPFAATLGELEAATDIVNVFRRPADIPEHLDDILAMRPLPRAVWFQLGIRNDEAAARLRQAGLEVIQDRCILIEHRALD
ncbi:MAG: CoA-binding protein [Trueperaceae bacterium]